MRLVTLEHDAISSNQRRHCERSEAIKGNVERLATPGSPRRSAPRDDDFTGRHQALGALAFVVLAAVTMPALAEDAPPKSAAMSRGWEFGEQDGAELFSHVCAACHQPDAKGAVGAGAYPPLAEDTKLVSIEFMLTVLLRGRKAMPPLGDMMSDAQVADVVNYVRTHFGNAYPGAVSAADVAAARRRAPPP
jgi:mono/diheme cytochrome c family protein